MNKDYVSPFNEILNRKRSLKLIFGFLDIAKKDRKASVILYDDKLYPLAVYHLQQSVEKIAKGYLLLFGEEYEKKFKDIGHNTPYLFFELLKDVQVMKITKPNNESKTKQDKEIEKLLAIPRTDISLLSKDEIISFINLFKNSNLESVNPDLLDQTKINKIIKGTI